MTAYHQVMQTVFNISSFAESDQQFRKGCQSLFAHEKQTTRHAFHTQMCKADQKTCKPGPFVIRDSDLTQTTSTARKAHLPKGHLPKGRSSLIGFPVSKKVRRLEGSPI